MKKIYWEYKKLKNREEYLSRLDRKFRDLYFINERDTIENIVDNDRLYFDYQSAQNNNESPEVIEQGLLLESVSSNYAESNTEGYSTRSIGLPIWGNYCGPGYGGKDSDEPVTDVLDEGCRRHDQCYKWSLTLRKNCKCNKDLVDYIDTHKNEMSGTMAKVAWAIRTYFNTIGQVGC